jgi:hypothetical protein
LQVTVARQIEQVRPFQVAPDLKRTSGRFRQTGNQPIQAPEVQH